MASKKLYDKVWSDGVFLDTNNVGSSVRWKVEANVHLVTPKDGPAHTTLSIDTEIGLSDCHRIITWSGYGNDQASQLCKIEGAIKALQSCEKAIKYAIKQSAKHHTRPKAGDNDD